MSTGVSFWHSALKVKRWLDYGNFQAVNSRQGELTEAALARELNEELGIRVNPVDLKPIKFASHSYEDFHLLMPLYACHRWDGELSPREGQSLSWVEPAKLHDYPAPAADIPLFDELAGESRSGHESAGK